jgi:cytoskeletal protein CcmA (bactofilin family)
LNGVTTNIQTQIDSLQTAGHSTEFAVTVATKTSSHPYYGSGSTSGYKIDGIESPVIEFKSGYTYKFDQSDGSNIGHPIRFYLDADKTTEYTTSVSSNGSAGNSGAYVQIIVGDSTPTKLFYQCANHVYMGYYSVVELASTGVTNTELGYLNDVTSAIQSQIDSKQAALTFGISDTNAVKIDGSSAVDDSYVRFTASGIEGRTTTELKTDVGLNNVTNESKSTMFDAPTFTNKVTLNGDLSLNQNLYINGDASFNGDVTIVGNLKADKIDNEYIINTETVNYTLIVAEDLSLNNRLFIQGDASFNEDVHIDGNLTVSGTVPTWNQNTTGTAAELSGTRTAKYVYAAPNDADGTASFRELVASDIPTLNQNTTGTADGLSGTHTANHVYAAPNGSNGSASFRALVNDDIPTLTGVDIDGGAIDGTAIGANSASTAKFTTLNASDATTLDGTVTLGNAAGDAVTVEGTITVKNTATFNGVIHQF